MMQGRPAINGRNNSMISSVTARTRLGPVNAESRLSQGAVNDLPAQPRPPGPWRLVLAVTIPFWIYLAFMRVATYSLATSGNPGIIIAPSHLRLLQHLVLLPMLLVFYRAALAVGWPERGRMRAAALHALMAIVFSIAARPVLLVLVAGDRGQWELMGELFHSMLGVRLSVDLWTSSFSDFLLSYVLGLAILLGVKNFRELKYHQLRAANLQAAWTHSRLQALRMQLNPHFLFNTLNAAVSLVSSRPKVAEQMLVRLADLLRRTLRDGESDFIPISREADFLRNYLEVQRLRFPDRLSFNVDVAPEVLNAAVPSLLLQPLAENAVVHSMAADAEQIRVDVSVRRSVRGLEMSVRNSAARARPDAGRSGVRLGVGLGNTRERLKTLFDDDYELELLHAEDGSVIARVRIPFIESAAQEAA
jgi:two-component system, LytTR family, sensor kinase